MNRLKELRKEKKTNSKSSSGKVKNTIPHYSKLGKWRSTNKTR